MPRGHLKNNEFVSRMVARGGSSNTTTRHKRYKALNSNCKEDRIKTPRKQQPQHSTHITHPKYIKNRGKQRAKRYDELDNEFVSYPHKKATKKKNLQNAQKLSYNVTHCYPVSECLICFENQPLICLSTKCKWHGGACYKCLRQMYATEDSRNTCFHPQCGNIIQFMHLEKHKILNSPTEIFQYHKMLVLAKIRKRNDRNEDSVRTIYCPHCEMPKGVSAPSRDRRILCHNCGLSSMISPDYSAIMAHRRFTRDNFGDNNGLARCPNCSILLSKGYGCDHINCPYCQHDFSWSDEVEHFNRHGPLAHIPENEIYLWW